MKREGLCGLRKRPTENLLERIVTQNSTRRPTRSAERAASRPPQIHRKENPSSVALLHGARQGGDPARRRARSAYICCICMGSVDAVSEWSTPPFCAARSWRYWRGSRTRPPKYATQTSCQGRGRETGRCREIMRGAYHEPDDPDDVRAVLDGTPPGPQRPLRAEARAHLAIRRISPANLHSYNNGHTW